MERICRSDSSSSSSSSHGITLNGGEMKEDVASCTCTGRCAPASASDDDDHDDDDDDVYLECDARGRGRPGRPDCVPKIDLSWTQTDHSWSTRPPDHVVRGHVTQCGRLMRLRRRIGRRRRATRRPQLHADHCALPLTPRTPRREIVRRQPEVENDAEKQEVEIEECGSVPMRDGSPCGSKNGCNCKTSTNCGDVISRRDVISGRGASFNSTSNASVPQYDDADTPVMSPITTDIGTETCRTGNSNEYADGEGYHRNAVSPSSLTNITQFSPGDDAVSTERKLECESSPSAAERLLCTLDCCHCCRLTLVVYRCLVPRRYN